MENTENNNNVFKYLLAIFFAVFVGTSLFLIVNNKKKAPVSEVNNTVNTLKQQELVIPTSAPTEASLSLQSDLPDNQTTVSTQFSLNLVADSMGKNIVGYDVVLFYDPLNFEFIEARSTLSDYKIFSYKKGNFLTLTALKNLDSQASPLSKVQITTLVFQPKKIGQYNFSLRRSNDNDKTDLITDKTEILVPVLNEVTIDVK